jgi:polysaccharide deacetylase family protein (PEP-CTERM system associated)
MTPDVATDRIVNAMTVDVEDYFHVSAFEGTFPRHEWSHFDSRVCANSERLLEIFDRASVSATFFILGWVAERFPALVKQIADRGHEIASHGYAHRLVYDQTPSEFRKDVRRAKQLLEDVIGRPVIGFRAPSYSVTPKSLWALDVLIEEGYQYDTSIFPIRHDRYGIPLSPRHAYHLKRPVGSILEVPASTVAWGPVNLPVAGGGYFRILPYAWTRWGISRVNRLDKMPAIFYLHPWEIDPYQPRLAASWLSRFRHYRNLNATESRLRRLLGDFSFGTVQSMLARMPQADHLASARLPLPYLW